MASTSVREATGIRDRPARWLPSASLGMVVLLVIQYVLGIAYNLYGTAPTASRKLSLFSSPLLAAHVIVGTLLVLAAIYLVVVAARARIRLAIITSVLGLLSILAAWGSGSAFAQQGAAGFSMAMGASTAVALLCYVINARIPGRPGHG
jgi:heme A synthase